MEIEAVQELEIETEKVGPQGYSAYEVAVQNGFEGTEEEWLESLKGADGTDGAPGPQGQPGADGQDGADAKINGVNAINIAAGENITLDQEDGTLTINSTGGGTRDYTALTNKPSINNVTLSGNKSLSDLGAGTYDKPASGIPKTDLASDVQASLSKADTALQTHQDISGKQDVLTAGDNITIQNNVISASGVKVVDATDIEEFKNAFDEIIESGAAGSLYMANFGPFEDYNGYVVFLPTSDTTAVCTYNDVKIEVSFEEDGEGGYEVTYGDEVHFATSTDLLDKQDVLTAGTNITIDENNVISATGGGQIIQYDTMPTADASTVGKIVQYTGTTNANYTNGYFYICTGDGTNYGWNQIDVQPGVEPSNIAVCTLIGRGIGTVQVQPDSNGLVSLSPSAQTELTTFLSNHLGKYIILQLIGNNNANCIIYLGYLQTTTGNNIQTFPKYIYFYGSGSFNGSVFYGLTKVMYSYNATTNKYSIGFYANPLDSKPKLIPDASQVLTKDNTDTYAPSGDYNPATKKYVDDAVAGAGGQTIQYETMPTASADTVGKIVQYTGTTDSNYTNGYFYIGTTDGEATPTYGWENINVQSGSGDVIVLTDPGNQYSTASSLNTEENRAQIKKLCELYSSGKRPVVCYMGCVRSSQTSSTPYFMYYAKYNIYYNDSNGRYTINFETVPAPAYTTTSGINGIGFKAIDQWIFNSEYNTNSDSVSFNNKAMVPMFGLEKYNNNPYAYPFSLENFCTKLGLEIYSTSKTYQIGDYIYARDMSQYGPGVRLYKCNTADTTGTWDSSKWTEATFMEYLSDTLVGGALNGSY